MLNLQDIHILFAQRGGAQYSGEPVTQLAHALQTAHLADQVDLRTPSLAHFLARAERCVLSRPLATA